MRYNKKERNEKESKILKHVLAGSCLVAQHLVVWIQQEGKRRVKKWKEVDKLSNMLCFRF